MLHGWTRNIVNAPKKHQKKEAHEIGNTEQSSIGGEEAADGRKPEVAQSTSDVVSTALASGNVSKEEVEKIIRLVALQAKDAKNSEDLEYIVMGALRGGTNDTEQSTTSKVDGSASSFVCDEDDDSTLNSDIGDQENEEASASNANSNEKSGEEVGVLSAEVIHTKTRNYVQSFLKQEKIDRSMAPEEDIDDDAAKSSTHSRSLKNNYAQVFMNLDASARDGGSMREDSKRGSMKDESKRGSMKDESKRGSMKDESRGSTSDGSKHGPRSDISNVLSKIEQAKARSQEIAKTRAKTQAAK
jgi:hypothetical protein